MKRLSRKTARQTIMLMAFLSVMFLGWLSLTFATKDLSWYERQVWLPYIELLMCLMAVCIGWMIYLFISRLRCRNCGKTTAPIYWTAGKYR